jgi:hypothetical protein
MTFILGLFFGFIAGFCALALLIDSREGGE